MTLSIAACDLVGDRTAVTLAGEARPTGHLGPAADSDVLLRRISVSADDVDLFDAAPDGSATAGPSSFSAGRTPDGRHVLVSGAVADAGLTIVRVPVDGGETTTLLTHDQPGMAALSLSPDGRRAAFVSELSRKEIWVLQGF